MKISSVSSITTRKTEEEALKTLIAVALVLSLLITGRKVAAQEKSDGAYPTHSLEVEVNGIWNEFHKPGLRVQSFYVYEHDSEVGFFGRLVGEKREGESNIKVYGGPSLIVTPWLKLGVGIGMPDTCAIVGMGRIGTCKANAIGFFEYGGETYDYYVEGTATPHRYFTFGFTAERFTGAGPKVSVIIPESLCDLHTEIIGRVLLFDPLHSDWKNNEKEIWRAGILVRFE